MTLVFGPLKQGKNYFLRLPLRFENHEHRCSNPRRLSQIFHLKVWTMIKIKGYIESKILGCALAECNSFFLSVSNICLHRRMNWNYFKYYFKRA